MSYPGGGDAQDPAAQQLDSDTAGVQSRRRRALTLLAGSGVLVVMGTLGVLYSGSFVWVDWLLEHPFVYGCFAVLLFGKGLLQLVSARWLKIVIGTATLSVVTGWLLIAAGWWWLTGPPWPVATAEAPGDSDYEAVVHERYGFLETIWVVSVRQTRGPLSREWAAGCITDEVSEEFKDVSWSGPGTLLVSTGDYDIVVAVDPTSGKPQDTIAPLGENPSIC